MKASDFATSSSQRVAESQALLQEEQTDAVNSGIVRRADKSKSMLKGSIYAAGKRRATGTVSDDAATNFGGKRRKRLSKGFADEGNKNLDGDGRVRPQKRPAKGSDSPGGDAEAPLIVEERGIVSEEVASNVSQKARFKTGAKGAALKAVADKALEDTELEGADEIYHKSKSVVRVGRGVKNRLAGKTNLSSKKGLGKLTEKKYRNKKRFSLSIKKTTRYYKPMVYATAEKRKAAHAVAEGSKALAKGGARGLLGMLGSASLPAFAGLFGVVLVLLLISAIFGGEQSLEDDASVTGFGDLTGVQLEVAKALADEGLGAAQIAAIMGNISGESGWDPNAEYHGEGNGYAYEYGYGLYQFTDTSGGGNEYTRFINWCSANGKSPSSAAAQTQFFIENLRNSWSTALHKSGYYTKYITEYAGKDASYDAWLATSDVGFATYCVMACWLRPADWAANNSFYSTRLPEAKAFYAKLSSSASWGSGQEYAASTATQRAIVDAAYRTPSTGSGWCAAWVSNVYQNAGLGYISGNACCMYLDYCTSADRSELKVGMIIAVQESPSSYGIWNFGHVGYGHVGIYIGDNKVMHNSATLQVTDLDEWISYYSLRGQPRWGWPSNVAQ